MDKPIAFIGARDLSQVPAELQTLYRQAAVAVAQSGRLLHTGAAPGADQMAAVCALAAGGPVHLFLPWKTFQREWRDGLQGQVTETVYDSRIHEEWKESVRAYHPAPQRLDRPAFALHARNYGIVHGCSAVVALPRSSTDLGGTGQGMRVAAALGIRVYNLWDAEAREVLESEMKGYD